MQETPQYPIDARDPLGRRVRCHRSWWLEHVVARKPEFAAYGMDEEVNRVITGPDEITRSQSQTRRRSYYGRGPIQHPNEQIRVVTEFGPLSRSGKLITCYLVRGIAPGETSEWKRQA